MSFGHIILDGPDATGKTTFANLIFEKYNMPIIHSDAKCANDYKYHFDLLHDSQSKFYDRFMGGEYVYPKIYNREPKLNISEMDKLFSEIVKTNSLYVVFNSSDVDVLLKRLAERGEYNYFDEIRHQMKLFKEFAYIFESYFTKYENFKYVDVSKPDAYNEIYQYAYDFIDKHRN